MKTDNLYGATCTGITKEAPHLPRFLKPPHNRKAIPDQEPECVVNPTEIEGGITLGRANENDSYFAVTILDASPHESFKVFFAVDFKPSDAFRFESAILSMTFGDHEIHDGSGVLKQEPIRIRDVFPTTEGNSERTFLEEGMRPPTETEEPVPTAFPPGAKVSATGIHSSTVRWTFGEEEDGEVKHGLDSHYKLFTVLPSTTKITSLRFWAKAVLVRGDGAGWGNRVTLKIGSKEAPYTRILDLNTSSDT